MRLSRGDAAWAPPESAPSLASLPAAQQDTHTDPVWETRLFFFFFFEKKQKKRNPTKNAERGTRRLHPLPDPSHESDFWSRLSPARAQRWEPASASPRQLKPGVGFLSGPAPQTAPLEREGEGRPRGRFPRPGPGHPAAALTPSGGQLVLQILQARAVSWASGRLRKHQELSGSLRLPPAPRPGPKGYASATDSLASPACGLELREGF